MSLAKYYIDLNRCVGEDFSEYEFDAQGIPLTRFFRKPDWQHNPVTVCQYGLFHFNSYVTTGDETSKEIFLTQANWLQDHAEAGPRGAKVWYYRIPIPFYRIAVPWISGMAQGEAISVLLRACQLTGDEKYRQTAFEAWKVFLLSIPDGGVVGSFPDGKPLVEEYPSAQSLTGVLNGSIFAMFGVYDFSRFSGDPRAKQLFEQLSDALKSNIHRYDCGYWSYYDLKSPRRLASKTYHRLHIELLQQLSDMTGEKVFRTYARRWQSYLKSSRCNLKWTIRKLHQKVFIKTRF